MGELENGEKIVELKIFNNPNFESIEDNSKQKKLDIFSIEIKTEEDENEKSEKNEPSFKTELIKKLPVLIGLIILLLISIFTHDLVKYDGLSNNSTISLYTTKTY